MSEPVTENAIRPSGEREAGSSQAQMTSEKGARPRRRLPSQVPDDVRRKFVQVGRKYFFPDGARAFTDRGTRLTTPSENTEVVRSLVSIAQIRGWESITVTGTERFRREAWFEARKAGIEVRGYKPSEIEQERLVRAIARDAERSSGRSGSAADAREESRQHAAGSPARGSPAPHPESKVRDRLIVGRLVDHGKAAYRHEPKGAISYFVRIETSRAERTLWGVDLERAIKESLTQPKIGDEVGLRAVGQDPVTVRTPRSDGAGKVIGQEELQTHRNRWIVEARSFFEARAVAAQTVRDATIKPQEAVKRHPELASTYLHLRGAEEIAARRIRDPEDQKKFVALVRSALADSVARGEPLQPARLREQGTDRTKAHSRSREPDPERTR